MDTLRLCCFAVAFFLSAVALSYDDLQFPKTHDFDHWCQTEDIHFKTMNGGCEELREATIWGMRLEEKVPYEEAERFCQKEYRDGGYSDWDLPTKADLLRLSKQNSIPKYFGFPLSVADVFWGKKFAKGTIPQAVLISTGEVLPLPKEGIASVVCVRREKSRCDFKRTVQTWMDVSYDSDTQRLLHYPSSATKLTSTESTFIRGPTAASMETSLCAAYKACGGSDPKGQLTGSSRGAGSSYTHYKQKICQPDKCYLDGSGLELKVPEIDYERVCR